MVTSAAGKRALSKQTQVASRDLGQEINFAKMLEMHRVYGQDYDKYLALEAG